MKLRDQGFTQQEIGAIVDMKPNTVAVRLRRLDSRAEKLIASDDGPTV